MKRKSTFRKDWPLYLLALPGTIALLLFSYFPMTGIILVFKDYNFRGGIFKSPWAQPLFKNFIYFFNNKSTAIRATSLTVMYNLLFFAVGTVVAVAIAIMLSEIVPSIFYFLDGIGRNPICAVESSDGNDQPDDCGSDREYIRFLFTSGHLDIDPYYCKHLAKLWI